MTERVLVHPNAEALARTAARDLADAMRNTVDLKGRFTLVLAGGSTPRRMYQHLAQDPDVPWDRVHFFLGDERFVPDDHPESNARMIRESLLTEVIVPAENVHLMDTRFSSPEESARAYEAELRSFFGGPPRFDCVLLGMGGDRHTLSIFPDAPVLPDDRLVAAVVAPPSYPTRERVTLTMAAIAGAERACFLVSGANKAGAVASVLGDGARREDAPAGRVRVAGTLVWYLDEQAASALDRRGPNPGNER